MANIDLDKFIQTIREQEFLWRKGHPEHKNKSKCAAAWQEIVEAFNFEDLKAAKAKWKNLTDYYNKLKKGKPTGSDGKEEKWPYLKAMTFFEEEKQQSTSRCNSAQSIDNELQSPFSNKLIEIEDDEDEKLFISDTPKTPRIKRPRLSEELAKADEFDNQIMGIANEIKLSMQTGASSPNSLFGTYVGSELKKLATSPERDEAKMQIMNIFMEIKSKRRGLVFQDANAYANL